MYSCSIILHLCLWNHLFFAFPLSDPNIKTPCLTRINKVSDSGGRRDLFVYSGWFDNSWWMKSQVVNDPYGIIMIKV
ncbi:hypothetical protein L6452_10776 [Arctium lappa]|uniref:Uncharacterized protein n=1 Tax=Arctium lappa TaxID=4217 RepID=A0ACB9DNW7_ARCLA|nr:hypothetical protein L6452_10776 [Arctium lappa]